MAKASWAVVNPSQGSGNKEVSVTAGVDHTGRNARSTLLTIVAVGVENNIVTANQKGKPEFVENTQDTASAAQGGQNVNITGKSNSRKLTFALGSGELEITLPSSYTAASLNTDNGAEIAGDPGASEEYDWNIVIPVSVNPSVTSLSRQIIVTDEAGNTDICTITQAAGSATLTVSTNSIELGWEQGSTASFTIESNTSWTIS
jgi:hypothetical protein